MILDKIKTLLRQRSFVSIATAGPQGMPHAAPKFLLKIENSFVYLVDYAIAQTVSNLRANPRACLSFMDLDNLEGYRVSGPATLIENGPDHEKLLKEFEKRLIQMSATRLIEGVKSGKSSKHFELEIPNKVMMIRVTIQEAAKIDRQGQLFKELAE